MSSLPRAQSLTRRRWLWPSIIALALAGIAYWFISSRSNNDEQGYRTEAVTRGEIRTAISATGTLSATATVDVGTQVSGILQTVDVDYNDVVKKEQIIARIDPSTYQARLDQASASLASARASVNEAQASARNAQADYARKTDLVKRQLVSRADADLALSARDQTRARIVSANAQVQQQQANVASARLDLEKTVIRSPVDGVVLSRAVEPGQTVAASLQTPVLFKIAGDLRQMEIVLAIDEADIGQVRNGQSVKFSVDAFPDRNFRGKVKQIRLAAANTANVITYPVLVEVDNGDQTLLPGMTANAEIEISNRENVLSIANAALRFKPTTDAADPNATTGAGAGAQARNGLMISESLAKVADGLKLDASQRATFDTAVAAMRERADAMRKAAAQRSEGQPRTFGGATGGQRPAGGGGNNRDGGRRMAERMKQSFAPFRATLSAEQQQKWDAELATLATAKRAPIYKLVDGKPEQVTIRIGASDGTRTEIMGEGLVEGDLIIVGSARPTDKK
jgi:HlyD family secretion protein